MPLLETKGAASAQGFGLTLQQAAPVYIEDVFSTWLYTGNSSGSSTQTITNGIDLAGKGGLVWLKSRSAVGNNWTQDTARGVNSVLYPNLTNAAGNPAGTAISSFDSSGFSLGTNTNTNNSGTTYASWTFRKQTKFFDVVTYTGTGSVQNIAHNLGSVPGCIIVKCSSTGPNSWAVYHRSLGNTDQLFLDSTNAKQSSSLFWNNTSPTSTQFTVGTSGTVNASGQSYVAYLFAHNAGGFGLMGTDNVISCGAFTADGSGNATITGLGYEPQWVLIKSTDFTDGWYMLDNMRGWSLSSTNYLLANTSGAETAGSSFSNPTADGFVFNYGTGANNKTFIYIAIRRGPMKTPTSGTSVFSPNAYSTTGAAGNPQTTGFPVDWMIQGNRNGGSVWPAGFSRLQGGSQYLQTSSTAAEATQSGGAINFDSNTNFSFVAQWFNNGAPSVSWSFRRAPGFFDVVCYTGTGAAALRNHNLGVAPELMIIKGRNFGGQPWAVYAGNPNEYLRLNTTNQSTAAADTWNYTTPTSTQFGTGTSTLVGASGWTYVAYLFASCPGVSKVGSYTGTGALQTVNCGFTGGARFVLIKRTDSTGDWWVYDSARGISSGNDPYLLLNSTAAEVTGTNYVDTTSVGFQVTAAAPAGLNASGGTYIFLAIA